MNVISSDKFTFNVGTNSFIIDLSDLTPHGLDRNMDPEGYRFQIESSKTGLTREFKHLITLKQDGEVLSWRFVPADLIVTNLSVLVINE